MGWRTLFDDDANGDGVDNGLAFLLGATGPNAAVPARTMSESGGKSHHDLQRPENDASRGSAILNIQHSSDLGIGDSWVSVPVTDAGTAASGVTFSITPGSPNNTVTATISNTEAHSGQTLRPPQGGGNAVIQVLRLRPLAPDP